MPLLKLTAVLIVFWNLQISFQMLLSQQVKRNAILTKKNGNYELTDELPNNVRLTKLRGIIF